MSSREISAPDVHKTLARWMLADGMEIVFDYERSAGSYIVDKRTGKKFLDFFSFFSSQPIGYAHPRFSDPDYEARLQKVSKLKISCSDVYTEEFASFVDSFSSIAMRDNFRHSFFISGGGLGVENALKAAFDWKVRKNLDEGKGEKGSKILHFAMAFHGRTGYTLSLTNTSDPRKYMYFPRFDWPRIDPPVMTFPFDKDAKARVEVLERQAVQQIEQAFSENMDDIAAIILEPIQAEGGDNHFRPQFFQELRRICDTHSALLIYDEVQTGGGLTGTFWAWEQLGVKPDLLSFGKKAQVCGVLSSDRIDSIKDNVFNVSSRLNSTWGPDCCDMVRSQKYIEIINEESLLDNVKKQGKILLDGLEQLARDHDTMSNARGRGLMCSIDAQSGQQRDAVIHAALKNGLVVLPCGDRSIRTRPFLNVSSQDVQSFLDILSQSMTDARKELR